MIIQRIQVEEGFLEGLDLSFSPGLNTVIGPRGSGKTSVVELLRFCLGIPGYTEDSDSAARQHALSILGSGRVTVTLIVDGSAVSVSRAASDEPDPRTRGLRPLILSQNEIESIGLHPTGRLRIVDAFRRDRSANDSRGESLTSQVRSLTVEARSLSKEIADINEQLQRLAAVGEELAQAQTQQASLLTAATASAADQKELERINTLASAVSVRHGVYDRANTSISGWIRTTGALLSSQLSIDAWPESAGPDDQLSEVRSRVAAVAAQLKSSMRELETARELVAALQKQHQLDRQQLEDAARSLRRRLEELKAGAGALARQVGDLKERAGQAQALRGLVVERQTRLESILTKRAALLDEVDKLRQGRYQSRRQIADRLNAELGPRIEVRVEQGGIAHDYVSAISAALRGTGLHYNVLGPQIATRMSPRELAEAAERFDTQRIADLASVTPERAAAIASRLAEHGVEGLLTASLDDGVRLLLLDGTEYKSTEELSTGQRCTAVLPILLGHKSSVLVADQPEDHLDNAFIVDTVVSAIRKRRGEGQLIFMTHNANIPVLGEADSVILLGSDGHRGFIRHVGPLDDPASVRAITSVMEGGRDAFLRRAGFYAAHLPPEE